MRRARTRSHATPRRDQRERRELRSPQRAIRRVVGQEAALGAVQRARSEQRDGGGGGEQDGQLDPPAGRRSARASAHEHEATNAADHAAATSRPARPRS